MGKRNRGPLLQRPGGCQMGVCISDRLQGEQEQHGRMIEIIDSGNRFANLMKSFQFVHEILVDVFAETVVESDILEEEKAEHAAEGFAFPQPEKGIIVIQHEAKEFPLAVAVFQQLLMLVVKIHQGIWFAFFHNALPNGLGKNPFGAEMVMYGCLGNACLFGDPFQPETMVEILACDLLYCCGNDPLFRHIRLAHETPLDCMLKHTNKKTPRRQFAGS